MEFIFGAARKTFFWQPGICFWGSQKKKFQLFFWQPGICFSDSQEFVFGAARKTFSARNIFFGQPEKCFSGSQEFIFGAARKTFPAVFLPGICFWGSQKKKFQLFFWQPGKCFSGSQEFVFGAARKKNSSCFSSCPSSALNHGVTPYSRPPGPPLALTLLYTFMLLGPSGSPLAGDCPNVKTFVVG
jgi:hypothetical protein